MSDLTYRLTELRSFFVPVSQLAAWPIFFLVTSTISLQPAYFLALILVLATDLFDSSPRSRGLIRDSIAGGTTVLLSLFLNDPDGLILGAIVATIAVSRIIQKRN